MKKRKYLILLIITIILFTGCNNKNNELKNPNNDEIIQTPEEDVNENENENKEEEKNELLPYTYKVPYDGYSVFVDVPAFPKDEAGYTEIFVDSSKKFVSFTALRDGVAEDAKAAFDLIYPNYHKSVDGQISINDENITETETLEINGIPVYRFKGTVIAGLFDTWEHYVYGYSFVFDNLPCAIIGIVTDYDQPQEEIDSVTEIVDAMIKTVRSEY